MQNQQPDLTWRSGQVPVSTRFDDPYYSLENGMAETRHVFLAGNGLPARFAPGFHIAELGFGTGLNALVAAQAWAEAGCGGTLTITSFEAFPLSAPDMQTALAAFPELAVWAAPLVAGWGADQIDLPGGTRLQLIFGDARRTLPAWQGAADAWFLDGFAPAKNPELWEPGLLNSVFEHTAPAGSFATYTAAGAVRRALQQAGFAVERVPGFGRKRHMTIGRRV